MSDFICKKCGGLLVHEDNDMDDTGHYEVLVCSTCGTDYHVYEDSAIWMRDNDGFFSEVKSWKYQD